MKCRKKVTYRTRLDAKIALARLRHKDHGETRIHWCADHGGYHTTSRK